MARTNHKLPVYALRDVQTQLKSAVVLSVMLELQVLCLLTNCATTLLVDEGENTHLHKLILKVSNFNINSCFLAGNTYCQIAAGLRPQEYSYYYTQL